jgi:hypothetical protein
LIFLPLKFLSQKAQTKKDKSFSIFQRLHPIIRKWLVATHDTRSPCGGLCKLNGITPHFSIRNFLSDVFRLISGVSLMTGLAASSLLFLIYVDKMEVTVPVPETR